MLSSSTRASPDKTTSSASISDARWSASLQAMVSTCRALSTSARLKAADARSCPFSAAITKPAVVSFVSGSHPASKITEMAFPVAYLNWGCLKPHSEIIQNHETFWKQARSYPGAGESVTDEDKETLEYERVEAAQPARFTAVLWVNAHHR